jgi:hypothetical protein
VFIGRLGCVGAKRAARPPRSAPCSPPSAGGSAVADAAAAGYERVEIRPGITRFTPLDFVATLAQPGGAVRMGLAFGAIYTVLAARISAFVTLALLVVSHWLLDYVTHRPDCRLPSAGRIASASDCGIRFPARWRSSSRSSPSASRCIFARRRRAIALVRLVSSLVGFSRRISRQARSAAARLRRRSLVGTVVVAARNLGLLVDNHRRGTHG